MQSVSHECGDEAEPNRLMRPRFSKMSRDRMSQWASHLKAHLRTKAEMQREAISVWKKMLNVIQNEGTWRMWYFCHLADSWEGSSQLTERLEVWLIENDRFYYLVELSIYNADNEDHKTRHTHDTFSKAAVSWYKVSSCSFAMWWG